jgi:hypothetical protein
MRGNFGLQCTLLRGPNLNILASQDFVDHSRSRTDNHARTSCANGP